MNAERATDPSAEMDHQTAATAALRGSGRVPVSGAVPRPGELMRNFTLPTVEGSPARLSELRGQRSQVLIFTGAPPLAAAVQTLLDAAGAFEEEDAQLVAVVAAPPHEARLIARERVAVLADAETRAHRQAGAERDQSAVYVTDRFGEIFAAWHSGEALPAVAEVVRTLRQISLLCPECGFPEWPME